MSTRQPRPRGQQRTHLLLVSGVVQHDQHLLAGQQAAVQGRLRILVRGHALSGDAQGVKEPADRLTWRDRDARRVEAAQVHVQLAVTKTLRGLVRPAHRQGGLADPGSPRHGADHHGSPRRPHRIVQQPVKRRQLTRPPGEVRGRAWQLARHDWLGGRCSGRGSDGGDRGAGEDLVVQFLQPRSRIDAKLSAQRRRASW